MRSRIFLLLTIIVNSISAQDIDVNFIGEGSKNSMKLLWLPAVWPDGLEGFNIKRRENSNQAWVNLNKSLIIPGNWLTKDLSNIEPIKEYLDQLIAKRASYFTGVTDPIDLHLTELTSDYIYSKGKDSSLFFGFSFLIGRDYDVAKMLGFATEDRNIPAAKQYEYGLFAKFINGNEKLVKSISWIYGSMPKIDLKISSTIVPSRNRKKVEVIWKFNYDDYKKLSTVEGFNMYRKQEGSDYLKLNKNRIWVSSTDSVALISYKDKSLEDTINYIYALVPVTVFNNEAAYFEIKYSPKDVPSEYPQIKLRRDSLQEKIIFSWTFNKSEERFLKGFKILRDADVNGKFDSIDFLNPSARLYEDKNPPLSKYFTYNYKIEAILKGYYPSNESDIVSFFNPPKPKAPKNLSISISKDDRKVALIIKWDPVNSDTFKVNYILYVTDRNPEGDNPSLYRSNLKQITDTEAKYDLITTGNRYGLSVAAVYNIYGINIEGEKSKIEFITIPSDRLNRLQFKEVALNDKRIEFKWVYNNTSYPDLKGFRIYNNDVLFVDENKINQESRTFTTDQLNPGVYKFQITAITKSGVESQRMPSWAVIIK